MHRGLALIITIALSTLLIAAKAAPSSTLEGYWKGSVHHQRQEQDRQSSMPRELQEKRR
jgi:hypothetical protein